MKEELIFFSFGQNALRQFYVTINSGVIFSPRKNTSLDNDSVITIEPNIDSHSAVNFHWPDLRNTVTPTSASVLPAYIREQLRTQSN